MTTYPIITSRKAENKILKLDFEIELGEKTLAAAQESKRWLDNWQPEHISSLQAELEQKRLEKHQIKTANRAEMAAVLNHVNGKARTWTICPDRLIGIAHECEDLLDSRGVKVKSRPGTIVLYRPGGKRSARIRIGRSITTYVVLRRVRDGWRLMHAQRDYCFINQRAFREVIVRPAAHEDIIRHATRGFRGWDEPPTDTPPEGPTT
ncbi:hypothetical protein [Sulfitobacter dubius]|jgi:hypothetical protein|uniref:hypothetical protein n=1 Tax=Sulfitobacter dubius TaxID=218673 RepID=UPI0008ED6370|nr:hypothetical protein [Sulfitobacter dubius]SFH34693.1 hypothetical protein SAMN04488039_10542 [Sulfitobacter dubius]